MVNSDFNNEMAHIKTTSINNGYTSLFVDRMITKKWKETVKKLSYTTSNSIAPTTKYFKVNYGEGRTFRIANKLRKYKMRTNCINKNN